MVISLRAPRCEGEDASIPSKAVRQPGGTYVVRRTRVCRCTLLPSPDMRAIMPLLDLHQMSQRLYGFLVDHLTPTLGRVRKTKRDEQRSRRVSVRSVCVYIFKRLTLVCALPNPKTGNDASSDRPTASMDRDLPCNLPTSVSAKSTIHDFHNDLLRSTIDRQFTKLACSCGVGARKVLRTRQSRLWVIEQVVGKATSKRR